MWREASIPRRKRITALGTVLGLHALIVALVLASRSTFAPPAEPGSLTVVTIAAPAAPSPAPPPPPTPERVSKLAENAEPPSTAEAAPAASAAGPPGPACATLELVMKAVAADPDAVLAVRNSPPELRSVAEAMIIWNEGWSAAAISADAPLGAARTVVERTLAGLPDGCLDEQVTGPRLVPVQGERGTMFVVIGSGVWRWRELLAVPAAPVGTVGSKAAGSDAGGPGRPVNLR